MKTVTFNVRDDYCLCYGQTLYRIKEENRKTFSTECPICKGTKTIHLNGFPFQCPACISSYTDFARDHLNPISVSSFKIEEYVINSVSVTNAEKKSIVKSEKEEDLPVMSFDCFHKCAGNIDRFHVFSAALIDPDDNVVKRTYKIEQYIFTTKQKATHAMKLIKNKETEQLKKYNEDNGTNFIDPFA